MTEPAALTPESGAATARLGMCLVCVALPWINSIELGPSTSMAPWLIAAACTATMWWTLGSLRIPAVVAVGLLLMVLAIVARPGGLTPEAVIAAGACLIVAACAGLTAGARQPVGLASWVAGAWMGAALLSCVIALCQYFDVADHFAPFMSVPSVPEAFGNLRQRNQFASLTAIGMVALLWFTARRLNTRYAVPVAVLLAIGNAASASRTGAVQLIMVTVFVLVWSGPLVKRQALVCAVALLAYLGASLALPVLQEAWSGAPGSSVLQRFVADLGCSSRRVLWWNVLELMGQKPWLGLGWGELDYAHYGHLYSGARFCDILDNAHNLPLHLAVELGLPVAAVLCGGLAWMILAGAPWRERDPLRQMAWSVLAVILAHSMVEYPLWYGPFQMAFGLSLGMLAMAPAVSAPVSHQALVVSRGAAAAFMAAIAFATWDYHRISQIYMPAEARSAVYREDTLDKIRPSWLFRDQVMFAELTMNNVSAENAQSLHDIAAELLHYSPEPKVVEKLLDSATLLGRGDEAQQQRARFHAAFPVEYAAWLETHGEAAPPVR